MSLAPQWRIGDLWLTEHPFMVEFGSDYGSPEVSPEVLPSFLSDGDLESTSRLGNRTVSLTVLVEGPDLGSISRAVDDLVRECAKPLNTLYCDPGDGQDEPFQFTVFATQPVLVRDDDLEQGNLRRFSVVWRALPSVESPVEVTDTLTATSVGSVHQRIGTFAVKGSVASRGSLSVQHETKALGRVLVYTCLDDGSGYIPACRQYRVSGPTVTNDVDAVSGGLETVVFGGSPTAYRRAASTLPDGEYEVVVLGQALDVANDSILRCDTGVRVAGSNIVGAGAGGAEVAIPRALGSEVFTSLGMFRMPPTSLPPTAEVSITITNLGADYRLMETYLLNVSIGRVSRLIPSVGISEAPAVGAANRLWIDSPGVENEGLGDYLMGTQADRSDAYSALLPVNLFGPLDKVPSVHEFPAEGTKVFTVTSGITNTSGPAAVTYRYRPAGLNSVYSGP